MTSSIRLQLEFGTDPSIVTIRKSSRSDPIIADVLGVDAGADGAPWRVYLRCKIHHDSDAERYEGWIPSGAISTILTHQERAQA